MMHSTQSLRRILWTSLLALGLLATACSSAPEPKPEPIDTKPAPPPEPVWPQDEFRASQPKPGPTPEVELPKVETFTIGKRGKQVTVHLIERHQLPVVSMNMSFPIGSANDPRGKEGLASLSMALLNQGTESLQKIEYEARQADLAVSIGTSSSLEDVGVSMRTLKRNLGPALDLLMEVLQKPGVRGPDLERLKKSREASLAQARATPAGAARRVWPRALYGAKHPRGRITTEAQLKAIRLADSKKFVKGLSPAGAKLFVAGDITRKEIEDLLAPRLGAWKARKGRAAKVKAKPATSSALYLINIPGAAQSQIYVGQLGPARTAEDYESISMMSRILGGGFSSRINMNLREKQGIAYGARAGFRYNNRNGYFVASSSVRTDATGLAITELEKEIKTMREGEPTPEELGREKEGTLLSLPARFATINGLLGTYKSLDYYGLPFDYYEGFQTRLDAVTAQDVQKAASTHLKDEGWTMVIAGDASVIMPQLQKAIEGGAFGLKEIITVDADGAKVDAP